MTFRNRNNATPPLLTPRSVDDTVTTAMPNIAAETVDNNNMNRMNNPSAATHHQRVVYVRPSIPTMPSVNLLNHHRRNTAQQRILVVRPTFPRHYYSPPAAIANNLAMWNRRNAAAAAAQQQQQQQRVVLVHRQAAPMNGLTPTNVANRRNFSQRVVVVRQMTPNGTVYVGHPNTIIAAPRLAAEYPTNPAPSYAERRTSFIINNEESRMPNFIQTNSATASRTPYLSKMSGEPRTLLSKKAKMKALSAPKRDESQLINRTRKEEINRNALPVSSNEREDEYEENLGHADTYSEYCPAKLRSGLPHPDSVVETASLSSVQPPDVRYTCAIPEHLIDTGAISALQLEAVIYACQMHENRLPTNERFAYLIGDGAGVGKGRTVACIIFENYLLGRKRSLWFSVSADLKFDAERDLRDIGASKIKVHALNKFKYSNISSKENGSVKRGVIFATYSSLIGECRTAKSRYRSRLKQLIHWCGRDFDGAIIFDECHRAKNLMPSGNTKPTKTGRMVLELQKALPNARIVYASATGATEPRNMAYMARLGLWGPGQPFEEFSDFINAVERRGVGAMEIVAMDMKQRGLYLARQLSFRGVTFRIDEVPLAADFIEVYDESVKLWLEARRQFQTASRLFSISQRQQFKQMWGQFWAAHQRFFKYLCIAAKVDACVRMCRDAVRNNKCVVIGLQSTGESRTLEQLDDCGGELTEFVSTAKAVFLGLIDKHFPTADQPSTSSAYAADVDHDFDKMMNDLSRPVKRYDNDRRRRTSNSSTVSSSNSSDRQLDDSIEDDGSSNSESESASDSDSSTTTDINDGATKVEASDDWVKTLLAEAESSSDDEIDDSDDGESGENEKKTLKQSDDDDEDSFNPFAADCATDDDDPWASKQQTIEDSPDKLTRGKKRKRKHNRRRKTSDNDDIPPSKVKKELNSEAQKNTADVFLASSSRMIDDQTNDSSIFGNGKLNLNQAHFIKAELMAAVERLGSRLPPNTLDHLIDELGGPECVAEMTGRKGRIVSRDGGEIEYELRHAGSDVPVELMNIDEKEKFMNGQKLVAIISEAASSGISLQSDRRAANQRRRVHITLELPWSADKAIQQFGRTHRSNQVSGPEYVFLISELAGEKRFASIVAKRLESLGALTHGDRRATETRDLSQFNLDTKYGRSALDVLLRTITGQISPPIPVPANYKPGNFIQDMQQYLEGVGMLNYDGKIYTVERDSATIPKFLNRLLGLPVHAQNSLFQYFSDLVADSIEEAKRDGMYDMGIVDLGIGGDNVQKLETRVFLGRKDKGSYRVELHKVGVERGINWTDAFQLYCEHQRDQDGFYVSTVGLNGKQAIALIYGIGKKRADSGDRLFCIIRPNTGRSPRHETFVEIAKRFRRTSPDAAEQMWKEQFEGSNNTCQHVYFHGKCRTEMNGVYCETGRRTRTYFVLSGSVLSVWPIVEQMIGVGSSASSHSGNRRGGRMQVIRVRTDKDQKIVGLLVMPHFVNPLVEKLEERCGRSYIEPQSQQQA